MSSEPLSPLQRLSALGQSVWVDYLSRESIRGGHLQELLDDYSVVGATSNPSIFEKAMTAGDAYDEQLRELDDGPADQGRVLGARRAGHQRRVRPVPPGLGRRRRPRRLRLAGGRPAPRLRHAGDLPRGDAPARSGRPPEPDGQDPGDQARAGGDRGRDRQGQLDQRHADLLAAALRGGRRVLHPRARAPRRRGRRPRQGGVGRELLRLAHRHRGRQAPGGDRRARRARGQARDRQREARLPALRGAVLRPALGVPAGPRAPRRSACCGRRRRPRTPPTRTRCTSRS